MKSDLTSLKRVASIDIGTNTILLLIAKVEGGEIHPLLEIETVARLGEGVQKNGLLLIEAMDRGLQTLAQYLKWCQEMEVQKIFAVGTSALREAKNSEDFLKLVKEKLNFSIEVISGEEEAQLSFLAVAKDLGERKRTYSCGRCRRRKHGIHPGQRRSDQSMGKPPARISPFYRAVFTIRSCSRRRMGEDGEENSGINCQHPSFTGTIINGSGWGDGHDLSLC